MTEERKRVIEEHVEFISNSVGEIRISDEHDWFCSLTDEEQDYAISLMADTVEEDGTHPNIPDDIMHSMFLAKQADKLGMLNDKNIPSDIRNLMRQSLDLTKMSRDEMGDKCTEALKLIDTLGDRIIDIVKDNHFLFRLAGIRVSLVVDHIQDGNQLIVKKFNCNTDEDKKEE